MDLLAGSYYELLEHKKPILGKLISKTKYIAPAIHTLIEYLLLFTWASIEFDGQDS